MLSLSKAHQTFLVGVTAAPGYAPILATEPLRQLYGLDVLDDREIGEVQSGEVIDLRARLFREQPICGGRDLLSHLQMVEWS